jgi:ribonucleoside-diphosphate reductase alpha subunit
MSDHVKHSDSTNRNEKTFSLKRKRSSSVSNKNLSRKLFSKKTKYSNDNYICDKPKIDYIFTEPIISSSDYFFNNEKLCSFIKEQVVVTTELVTNIINFCASDVDRKFVDLDELINIICTSTPEKITLNDLYNFMADKCASKTSYHPDYKKIASKLLVERLHVLTPQDCSVTYNILYNNKDENGCHNPLIDGFIYKIIIDNKDEINRELNMSKDYLFDYFAIRTLERSYLLKVYNPELKKYFNNGNIIEPPQHMIMRMALGIHGTDLKSAFETYRLISDKLFTHATPTLFNSGTKRPQMSSCFLLSIEDSIEEIFNTVRNIAYISKWAGGIGLHMSAIRAKGSIIRGTNGSSDGIIPLCIMLNKEAKYINQGGKRNGSIAVYLEPWHADIFEFCELRKNSKDEDGKARDLFLALWIPDLFMQRVLEDGVWSLMCPDACPGLCTTYGEEFNKLYLKYESEGKYKKQVRAVDLWYHILESQIETGMPYMAYKDHANNKSNQKNLGTIRSSNLCCEIIEYSDSNEIAVCNLGSVCLTKFVTKVNGIVDFDYTKLIYVTRVLVRNLNKVIDNNYYPTKETMTSNSKHRPIAVGIQGLADVYNMFKVPFGSDQAKELNKRIFETIYYASLLETIELARKDGPYESFNGSPFSQGILQYHMWGLKESDLLMNFDWKSLIEDLKKYGARNSLLTALMPTASTAQIMGNSECFEPIMSNIFVRSTLAGEFIVINENLVDELLSRNLWNSELRTKIIVNNGSLQDIDDIPDDIKEIYKTAFEVLQMDIIQQSIDRGPFVDQSQSMNLFLDKSDFDRLTSAHFYGWEGGLKTGMYYLRSQPAVDPINFGVDVEDVAKYKKRKLDAEEDGPNKRQNIDVKDCKVCT